MSLLVSVIGEPGVGKTTATRAAWDALGCAFSDVHDRPVPHVVRYDSIGSELGAELGRDRCDFGGTDALAMNIMPAACEWIADAPHDLVVAEGDRLAAERFYAAARASGRKVVVVRLIAPPEVSAGRRAARGGRQAPAWVAGRRTKVGRLAEAQGGLELDASAEPVHVGAQLAAMIRALA